jgi:hypothetical protein
VSMCLHAFLPLRVAPMVRRSAERRQDEWPRRGKWTCGGSREWAFSELASSFVSLSHHAPPHSRSQSAAPWRLLSVVDRRSA